MLENVCILSLNLMEEDTGFEKSYYKPSEKELLEDYLKVVELLTFDDESSLRRRVDTLLIEKSRIDMLEAKIQKLERKHGSIR